ncbi:hypothetical protein HK405_007772 [Cladochytrium tenue]|nr:hypothetical protein HK405_007772 [Cladochytrium tenue]
MLRKWIHHGVIDDPFNEFMIFERQGVYKEQISQDYNDIYWEQRYTLRKDKVPSFLAPVADKVLLAGKYLNVVRECGETFATKLKKSSRPDDSVLEGAMWGQKDGRHDSFAKEVDLAYKHANETLLDVLFKSESLRDLICAMKHYLLLDRSDFLTHFLDLAAGELARRREDVSVGSLVSILELVLRNPGSVTALDPFKDFVSVELSPYSLVEQLLKVTAVSGVDYEALLKGSRSADDGVRDQKPQHAAIGGLVGASEVLTGSDTAMLSIAVPFPASLVLNKRVITKHQLLFRHLLHCKAIERLLSLTWMEHVKEKHIRPEHRTRRSAVRGGGRGAAAASSRAPVRERNPARGPDRLFANRMALLRNRQLHFVQQVLYFLSFEVVEPHWQAFEARLDKAGTLEEVLDHHNDFLDSCLKDFMLTNPKLLKAFWRITRAAQGFVEFADAFARRRHGASLADFNPADSFSSPFTGGPDASATSYSPDATTALNPNAAAAAAAADAATLARLEDDHLIAVRGFLDALRALGPAESGARLLDLADRLDYSGYYSRTLVAGLGQVDLRGLGSAAGTVAGATAAATNDAWGASFARMNLGARA